MYSSICLCSASSLLVLLKGHTCIMYKPVLHYKDWILFWISALKKTDIAENFVGKVRGSVAHMKNILKQDAVQPFSAI